MKKPVILIIAVAVILTAAAYFFTHRKGEDRAILRVSGNIEVTSVEVSFKIPGRMAERLPTATVGLFGDRLHLVTDDPARMEALASEMLNKEGVEILNIRRIEPSLEDLFVSVLSREEA